MYKYVMWNKSKYGGMWKYVINENINVIENEKMSY